MNIIPYKMGSASAKALATALGTKRVRQTGRPIWKPLINWGCSQITREYTGLLLNEPSRVALAVNKLSAFNTMSTAGVPLPAFTESREQAVNWLAVGYIVVCRTRLTGHSGEGIVIASTPDQIVDAPLYVRYLPKANEYRIHVGSGNVFFTQRKARKMDVPDEEVNWQVRNLSGGFIYANQNIEASDEMKNAAITAVQSLGLDFGAVDVLETPRGRIAVLEVNTACGLSGTTLEKYVEYFQSLSRLPE